MADPTAALEKAIELANKLRDASQALPSNATQSQQDAEVQRLTSLCQALIGEAFAAPEEATGIFALAGLSIGMAAAAQEEQNCRNASQSLVAEFDSSFNSAENSLATDESSYQLNNSQTSDFSNLNANSSSGNTNGAISASNQLLVDSQFVGVTDNSTGITYQQTGLDIALSTNWQPIKLDQENSNGTSQITIYNPDGSSTSTYYSGANGTGSITEIDQENVDGTSQITIPGNSNSDTPTITTYYSGSNGTGTITKTDQENSNGTSQITIYNPDGSSTSSYYSGADGTGSVTEIDQENADGTSTITTFSADGSSTSLTYNGPNGTGPLTQTTVTNASGNITSQSIGAVYTYTGNELHTNPPASSPVGILTGSATFSVNANTGALDQTSYELDFDAFGTHITNTYYANLFTFEGSNIVEWFVSELSTDHLSGYLTDYAPSSGDYGQDAADSGSASGGNYDDPGTWAFSGDVATMMISPTAGQTQSLSDALTNSYLTAEGSIQNVTIAGYGNVVLTGFASISNILVTGNLVLNNATLNTDPITINSGGTLSANDSTLTGAVTNNSLITADGGVFDMTGEINGTGMLAIDAGTLFVEGTVAATQILDFGGTAAALLIGTSADVTGSVTGFAPGDMIALAGQEITGFAFDTAASQLTLTSSGGTDVTLALTGTAYNAGDFALVDGELVDEHALCFVEGTRIRTPQGERPIEALKIGDLVTTASGEEKPVKWIGKRDYKGAFIADNHLALPITIRKNAIAGNVPADDLEVSPGHGILIAGVLIPAWRLVNGISITQAKAEDIDTVRYLNIELEDHAVIMAQGCGAETFLNIGDFRKQFQNAAEYEKLYANETARVSNPLPRVEQGALLRDIQNYLNKRAGLPPQPEQKTDTMRGCVDEASPKTVRGWAQTVENPETPVSLDVLYFIGGTLHKETVVANQYRADLRKEKLGSGCHQFKLELPVGAVNILVRRTINPDQHLSLTMNANQAHEAAEARIKNDCPGKPVTSVHRRHVGYPKNRRQLETRRLIA